MQLFIVGRDLQCLHMIKKNSNEIVYSYLYLTDWTPFGKPGHM